MRSDEALFSVDPRAHEKVLREWDIPADTYWVTPASISEDPRRIAWPTVPGRLPLTEGAVSEIASISDGAVRNIWITQSYADLARRLLQVSQTDQTWCTFAIWASNTAGVSIRGEELPLLVNELLLGADDHCGAIIDATNRCTAALRHMGMVSEFQRSHLEHLVAGAVRQVSGFIANGNNLVFKELGPLFVRFVDVLETAGPPQPDQVDATLDRIGVPSAERSINVRTAFREYAFAVATHEPRVRAQHVLAGNVSAVLHEQERLQPDIEAALDSGLIDFGDDLAGVVRGHVAEALFDPVVHEIRRHLAPHVRALWQHVATKLLMTMTLPNEKLHLGVDVPVLSGEDSLFPRALQTLDGPTIVNPTLVELFAKWDPTHGTGRGSAAHDWADLGQRMGYIVNLFRSRQQELCLTAQPFNRTELAFMERDQLPRSLALDEPAAMHAPVNPPAGLLDSVPHMVVCAGQIEYVGPQLAIELGCNLAEALVLQGRLHLIGTPLDDHSFEDLSLTNPNLRVRLVPELADRPVRLRVLAIEGERQWLEVRSLADEFRMESLLRRSGIGHMLISPKIELQWSLSADGMLPGDNPLNWVELMDADDMQVLGKAIYEVGNDPSVQRDVRHRLNADRTYTMIDRVESVVHDPDLRAVLVRSYLEGAPSLFGGTAEQQSSGITVSDHMTIGVVVASSSGRILHRNAAAAKLVRARAGQSVVPAEDESWMMRRLGEQDAASFVAVFGAAAGGVAGSLTVPSPVEPGRWLRIAVAPAAASTVVMTVEDMTELAEAERALRASNSLLAALDAHSEELVIVFDQDGATRYTSSSVRRHLGDHAEIGHPDDFIQHVLQADRAAVDDLQRRVRLDSSQPARVDLRVTVDDPAGRWHHATMTNLLDDPDVRGFVLTLRDVHERHLLERELRFRATHDELTTLPDRAGLRTRLDEVLADSVVGSNRTAVMFCDIDNFKTINDQYGHHFGDFVLTELAARLRASMRVTDFVGRFGGDEFVVVFPDVDDDDHALALAAGVFQECMGPAVLGQQRVDISVSMGLAVSQTPHTTVEELLQRADQAMYQSKNGGRGRLSLFAEVGDKTLVVQ